MSLYRCAICGSSKVVLEHRREGYPDLRKRIASVLFDHGIWDKLRVATRTYYCCKMCGEVLDYTMSHVEKEAIDKYITHPEIYEMGLKEYKKQYKNIEWG